MGVAVALRSTVAVIPKVELKLRQVQAQVYGELVNVAGGSAREVKAAQEGALEGWLASIRILGIDRSDFVRDEIRLDVEASADGTILVDADGEKSMVERVDAGFARAIGVRAERLKARGLKASVWFHFTEEVENNPQKLAAARAQLGLSPSEPPKWSPGAIVREVLNVAPGGSGLVARFWQELNA